MTHDDHDGHDEHDDHNEEAHNEFVAHYSFNFEKIKEIDRISFPYFTNFSKLWRTWGQFYLKKVSTGFEVEGNEPFIDLKRKNLVG
ncbi:MAG: hypothetical protein CM15mP106_3890 [Candidatus Neomarinimicrobiota bacterium]|nr:MAG: hypothetical protein CM15mP106_3890 [Candidatus Neomarinimicrobiota bacterium]